MRNILLSKSPHLFIYSILFLFIYSVVQTQELKYLNIDYRNFQMWGQASYNELNRKQIKICDATEFAQSGGIQFQNDTTFNLRDTVRIAFYAYFGVETKQSTALADAETNSDGIAFVLHKKIGGFGGPGFGIGYASAEGISSNFTESIAIEFDTYYNDPRIYSGYIESGDTIPFDDLLGPHISIIQNGDQYLEDDPYDKFKNILEFNQVTTQGEFLTKHLKLYEINNDFFEKYYIEDGKFHCIEIIWEPNYNNHDNSRLTVKIDGGVNYGGIELYLLKDLINFFEGSWSEYEHYYATNYIHWSITGASGALSSYEIVHFNNEVDVRPDLTICYGDTVLLATAKRFNFVNGDGTPRNESFRWTPIDGLDDPTKQSPVARPEVTTKYKVQLISDDDGQITEDEILVTVEGKPEKRFIKSYGGLFDTNSVTFQTKEEINGLLKTHECGYLLNCQSDREFLPPDIDSNTFIKKALLIKTDCDGNRIWDYTYTRKPDDSGTPIQLCAFNSCNLFKREKKQFFDLPEEYEKYFYDYHQIGYAFTGQMDNYINGQYIHQMYACVIDTNGDFLNYKPAISFKYSKLRDQIYFGYHGEYITQTKNGSLFLLGSSDNLFIEDYPEDILITKFNIDFNEYYGKVLIDDSIKNISSGIDCISYTISDFSLRAFEIKEISDGNMLVIGYAHSLEAPVTNKIFLMKIKDSLGLPAEWTYLLSIPNEFAYGSSLIEDGKQDNVFYLLGNNNNNIFIIKMFYENNQWNFRGKRLTSVGLTSIQPGQIVEIDSDELAISFNAKRTSEQYRDAYFIFVKKDMNDYNVKTYYIDNQQEDYVFNLLDIGFGGIASGLQSHGYEDVGGDLVITTFDGKNLECQLEEEYELDSLNISSQTVNTSRDFLDIMERHDIERLDPEVEDSIHCDKTICYCDKSYITPLVTLLENNPESGQCCYKIEFQTNSGFCPVDEVNFKIKDSSEETLLDTTLSSFYWGSLYGSGADFYVDFCVNEFEGTGKVIIQYYNDGDTLRCVHEIEIGCKCTCEEYTKEDMFDFVLIPVELDTLDCCYDIYMKSNYPCGMSEDSLTIKYNDQIHLNPDSTENIFLTFEDGWMPAAPPIHIGDYWYVPIHSPSSKRVVSNGERVKIGTICQLPPVVDSLDDVITISIDTCGEEWDFNINCDKNCCDNRHDMDTSEIKLIKLADSCCFTVKFKYGNEYISENCGLNHIEITFPSGENEQFVDTIAWNDEDPTQEKSFDFCIPDGDKKDSDHYSISMKFVNNNGYTICKKVLNVNASGCSESCCDTSNLSIHCTKDTTNDIYYITIDSSDCELYGLTFDHRSGWGGISKIHYEGDKIIYEDLVYPIKIPIIPPAGQSIGDSIHFCLWNRKFQELCCFDYYLDDCAEFDGGTGGTGSIIFPGDNEFEMFADSSLHIYNIYFAPNPANNQTMLNFNADKQAGLTIDLFGKSGEYLKTFFDGQCVFGINSLTLNTKELSSGIYVICIRDGMRIYSSQLIIIK